MGILDGKPSAAMARDLKLYLKHPDKLFRRVRDEHGILQLSKNAVATVPDGSAIRLTLLILPPLSSIRRPPLRLGAHPESQRTTRRLGGRARHYQPLGRIGADEQKEKISFRNRRTGRGFSFQSNCRFKN